MTDNWEKCSQDLDLIQKRGITLLLYSFTAFKVPFPCLQRLTLSNLGLNHWCPNKNSFFLMFQSKKVITIIIRIDPGIECLPSAAPLRFKSLWVAYLPTSSSSLSEARGRCFFQMSMVKSVELLLKMEVSDDIRAAIITAIISPRKPVIHTHTQAADTSDTFRQNIPEDVFRAVQRCFLPLGMSSMTSLGKAMLEHPTSAPHTRTHSSGSTHPTESEMWGRHRT